MSAQGQHMLQAALAILRDRLKLEVEVESEQLLASRNRTIDALISIKVGHNRIPVAVEIRKTLQVASLKKATHVSAWPTIFVSFEIHPKIRQQLESQKIGYIDLAGKVFLPFEIYDDFSSDDQSQFRKPVSAKAIGLNSEGILKVILVLLSRGPFKKIKQQEIADLSGVSIGTVNRALMYLREHKYLYKKDKTLKFDHGAELLEKWALAFGEFLQPHLALGTFRSLQSIDSHVLMEPRDVDSRIYVSGEMAAERLTNRYRGKNVCLYLEEKALVNAIKFYQLIKDPMGSIKIYNVFWSSGIDTGNSTLAPVPIVYADLINSRDSRNREIAEEIGALAIGLNNDR